MELANRNKDNKIVFPVPLFGRADNPWHNKVECEMYPYHSISIPFIQFDWPIPMPFTFLVNTYKAIKECDVVHIWTFFYLSSWMAMCMGSFLGKKVVMSCDTFPGITFKSGAIDYLFKAYYILFGWTFKIVDVLHVYTYELEKVAKRFTKNVIMIPTGIHVSKFKSNNKPNKTFKIIYAGSISKRKGIDRLVYLARRIGFCQFHVYGEGPDYLKYVTAQQGSKQYSKNITYHGWSKNLPKDLASGDCLILLSRGEGLPGIVMEAMACGLPVIATEPSKHLVEDLKTGYIVKDFHEAKEAISIMRSAKKIGRRLGKSGRSKINNYDWKKLYKKYEVLLYENNNNNN